MTAMSEMRAKKAFRGPFIRGDKYLDNYEVNNSVTSGNRSRAFGGLAASRLQPENFQKIRAGWPYSEPRLIQLERLEF